jgi:hypothetical protein
MNDGFYPEGVIGRGELGKIIGVLIGGKGALLRVFTDSLSVAG